MSTVLGPSYRDLVLGDSREAVEEPITRVLINRYAGASGDFNPSHVHERVPAEAGMEGIFAHGMIGTGYLGKLVTDWVLDHPVRRLDIRATKVVRPGATLRCRGTVVRKWVDDARRFVAFELEARDQDGDVTHHGEAVVEVLVPERPAPEQDTSRGTTEFEWWRVIG